MWRKVELDFIVMNNRHLIDSAVFEISYDQEVIALDQRSEVEDYLKNDLMVVVDEVFNEIVESGIVIRMPSVEIDLGDILYEEYKDEMPKKLREKLISKLSDIRYRHKMGQVLNGNVINEKKAVEEQLFYYLINGHLPWYSRLSSASALELVLMRIIESNPERIRAFIYNATHKEAVIERLVNQFSDSALSQVFRSTSSYRTIEAQKYIAELRQLIQNRDFPIQIAGIDTDNVISRVWRYLISASVSNTREQINFEQLFEQALRYSVINDSQLKTAKLTELLNRVSLPEFGLSHLGGVLKNLLKEEPTTKSSQRSEQLLSEYYQTLDLTKQNEAEYLSYIEKLYSKLVSVLQAGDVAGFRSCWTELYSNHARLLVNTLRYYGQQARIRKLLASKLPDDMLHSIIMLLEPSEYGFIQSVIDNAELFQLDITDSPSNYLKHKVELWEYSLAYLLIENNKRFDKNSYLSSLIRQMAVVRNQSQSVLLSNLSENIVNLQGESQPKLVLSYIDKVINNLLNEVTTTQPDLHTRRNVSEYNQTADVERKSENERLAYLDELQSKLVAALHSGDMSGLGIIWPELCVAHAELLEKSLRYYGQQARVRKHIAVNFSDDMLHDVVVLLEPTEHGFVQTIIDHVDNFKPEKNDRPSNPEQHKVELWEFSLAYLLVERGSRFNKKSYLASLIRQMAASRNQNQTVLLIKLKDNITRLPKSNKLVRGVLQFLKELGDDLGVGFERKGEVIVEQTISYKEFDRLQSLFAGATTESINNQSAILADLETLTQKTPWLLMRLFRELQFGDYPWRQSIDVFSVQLLRQLVHSFLVLTSQADATHQSDFVTAIQINAAKSKSKKNFYLYILECFIKGELINFDAIETTSLSANQDAADQAISDKRRSEINRVLSEQKENAIIEPLTKIQAEQMLSQLVDSDHPPSEPARVELLRIFERLMIQQTLLLRQLLESVVNEKQVMARLLKQLPERLQAKLNSMMGSPVASLTKDRVVAEQNRNDSASEVGQADSVANEPLTNDQVKQVVTQLLDRDHPPSEPARIKLLGLFERLMVQQTPLLRQLLESVINDKQVMARLFEQLPERLQAKLYSMMGADIAIQTKDYVVTDTNHTDTIRQQKNLPDNAVIEPFTDDQVEQVVARLLDGGRPLSNQARVELLKSFEQLLVQKPIMLRQLLESGMKDLYFIKRLAEQLPEYLQVKLLSLLGVVNYEPMLQCAEMLNMACYAKEMGLPIKQLAQLKWQFIYSYMSETSYLFNEKYFVRQYVDMLMKQAKQIDVQRFRSILSQQLLQNNLSSTQGITQRLIELLSDDMHERSVVETSISTKSTESDEDHIEEPEVDEEIYVTNAGIVLAAPYLPRLFDMLGLIDKSAFKDRESAERGVHLLQFMVNENVSSPEFQLVLNKLLCGVKPGRPIRRGIEINPEEKDKIESLLLGIIENWKSLGNTSITGLRESFLQRNGKLQLKNDAWTLSVEAKSFDMLLDQVPWSYSTIKFPWMDRVIYVEWR